MRALSSKSKTASSEAGITLIEVLIYIALFSLLLTGLIASMYPLFTNIERSTIGVVTEGESAFILRKISWALSSATSVWVPNQNTLNVVHADAGPLTFSYDVDAEELSLEGEILNATRVKITNFSIAHDTIDKYIEVSFDAGSRHVGPVRYYLHF